MGGGTTVEPMRAILSLFTASTQSAEEPNLSTLPPQLVAQAWTPIHTPAPHPASIDAYSLFIKDNHSGAPTILTGSRRYSEVPRRLRHVVAPECQQPAGRCH